MKLSTLAPLAGAALILVCAGALPAQAQDADLEVKTAEQDPPSELAEPIREVLNRQSLQFGSGDEPAFEIWLRQELPVQSKPNDPAQALGTISPGTLVGALRVNSAIRDFRDDRVKTGVYTLRYAHQPQDGDHMGTAPEPHFVILVPADVDTALEGPDNTDAVVEMTKGEKHPRNLNLRPVEGEIEGETPALKEGFDDTRMVQVKVPAKAGEESFEIAFAIVVEGHGEI